MRSRAAVVIIREGYVVLIKRIREGQMYYVFPGGGIEEGETPEQAAEREAVEELGVTVKLTGLLAVAEYDGPQFFFSADILTGTIIGTGTGAEFTDPDRDRGTYELVWVPTEQLSELELWPERIRTILAEG